MNSNYKVYTVTKTPRSLIVKHVTYDAAHEILTVRMRSKNKHLTFVYHEVTDKTFQDLLKNNCEDRYFLQYIEGNHDKILKVVKPY